MSDGIPPAPPPGAYGVPVGGYRTPVGGYRVPPSDPPRGRGPGLLALLCATAAAIVAPVISGILALQIGTRVPLDSLITPTGEVVWSTLTPVRTQVLWIEILFWTGTIIGIVALVVGIIAAARRRGRGAGIAAIVLAALGPVGFLLLTSILMGVGSGLAAVAG